MTEKCWVTVWRNSGNWGFHYDCSKNAKHEVEGTLITPKEKVPFKLPVCTAHKKLADQGRNLDVYHESLVERFGLQRGPHPRVFHFEGTLNDEGEIRNKIRTTEWEIESKENRVKWAREAAGRNLLFHLPIIFTAIDPETLDEQQRASYNAIVDTFGDVQQAKHNYEEALVGLNNLKKQLEDIRKG